MGYDTNLGILTGKVYTREEMLESLLLWSPPKLEDLGFPACDKQEENIARDYWRAVMDNIQNAPDKVPDSDLVVLMNELGYPYKYTELKVCHTDFAVVLELPHHYKLGLPVNIRRYREEPINSCVEYLAFIEEAVHEGDAWRVRPAHIYEDMSDAQVVQHATNAVREWYAKHPHLNFRIYQQ